MIGRRAFVVAAGTGLVAIRLAASAQQLNDVRRIGFLTPSVRTADRHLITAFMAGLQELGWIEGKNLRLEYRSAEGDPAKLPELAAELVRNKVELIVAVSTPGAQAAKRATNTVPIVFGMVSDPVASGIVVSLSHPTGNATGWSNTLSDISGKLLEISRQVVPGTTRFAVLWNPQNSGKAVEFKEMQAAATSLGVTLQSVEIRAPEDLNQAFLAITTGHSGALVTFIDAVTFSHRQRIVEFALQNRLPGIFQAREFVDSGGLLSYSPNMEYQWRRAAIYVDKILKGAKPGDLPVEQPTKFELVINLKTAKALGISVPQSLLLRADELIQ